MSFLLARESPCCFSRTWGCFPWSRGVLLFEISASLLSLLFLHGELPSLLIISLKRVMRQFFVRQRCIRALECNSQLWYYRLSSWPKGDSRTFQDNQIIHRMWGRRLDRKWWSCTMQRCSKVFIHSSRSLRGVESEGQDISLSGAHARAWTSLRMHERWFFWGVSGSCGLLR